MHETPEDLARLQDLLDRSYGAAGPHLRSIITPDRRLDAAALSAALPGMRLLTLATVTADGRPLTGAVDGMFYKGAFWFGSSPDSVRMRHIRRRPAVSATHLPGEHLSVSVHGRAVPIDYAAPEHSGFADYCVEIYGEVWREWDEAAAYARIDADRMFTFWMPSVAEH